MSLVSKRLRGAALLLLALLVGGRALAQSEPDVPRRGVNVLGYDPIWNDPAQARFQLRHMQAIRDGGFDHVRMNLQAFAHMDAKDQLSPAWMKQLDALVDAALKAGLQVIIDEHNFNECAQDIAPCRAKLLAFWHQVAPHLRAAPDGVLFEILNEPNGAADAVWNDMLAENLAVIRESNPTRRVVVGPKFWNNFEQLDSLRLPDADRRLVVTFHYYAPMEFTHQGAYWTPQFKNLSGVTWGTAADRERLQRDFDRVKAWSDSHHRPILLGEFGALESAGMAQRTGWISAVARAAEARGFGWCYWQFDSDFVVWDMKADGWVAPIHAALIPDKTAAAAPPARSADPALDYLVNTPQVSAWSFYGDVPPATQVPCAASGKVCLRVALLSTTAKPWDIGATVPLQGAIAKGDTLQALVWARLDTEDDRAKAVVPVLLQLGSAPYTAIVSSAVTLTNKLQPVAIRGVATRDFEPGSVNLALQMGQVGRPVVLGAPYVLKNYKPPAQ